VGRFQRDQGIDNTGAVGRLVTGMDKEGNVLVEDPADRNVRSVTPANLEEFFRTHAWGGGAIAIG
jgi:hypothetical protein